MRESVQTRHYHLQALIHWGQFLVNISLWTNKTNVNINSAANKFLFEVKNTIHRRKYLVIETDRKYSTYMRFNNLFSYDSLRFRINHREPDRVFHIYSILQKIFVVNLKKAKPNPVLFKFQHVLHILNSHIYTNRDQRQIMLIRTF